MLGAGEFGEMHLQAFSLMHREGQTELVGMAGVNPAPPTLSSLPSAPSGVISGFSVPENFTGGTSSGSFIKPARFGV